ncbi:uncharacterized protein LOC130447324 [Diorhabda sublineata]|uniref:uncharacterized protein LOC130447324 n=1 Tax=Diorhabda sublineata TaxID=1163346 RepID=UPI0024E0C7CF|nr:uncharacterized protein LOC130447324 [Diorhabda sublineata]
MAGKNILAELQLYTDYLKERTLVLREENARLEMIFKRLKMLNDENRIPTDISEKISEIKETLINTPLSSISQTERLRKHHNYLSKLKICIKIYININERLSGDIKMAKRELEHSNQKLAGISNLSLEQIQQLEEKAKRYENEVSKFERKYPWLKDPMFDLPNITKETQKLQEVKTTKEKLIKELSVYQGLKPDIREANQQLAQIKEEHNKISALLLDSQVSGQNFNYIDKR